MQDTQITDKGFKVCVDYAEHSYEPIDIFGEGIEFRFDNKLRSTITTKPQVIAIALGNYDIDENDSLDLYYKQQAEELLEKYYIYPISTYEHSAFAFHLGYRQGRDYSNNGALLLDKSLCSKRSDENVEKFLSNDFTNYINGRVYKISIYKPHKWTDNSDDEMTTRDYVDGLSGFFRDYLNEAYSDYFEDTYGKVDTFSNTY